MSQSIALLFGVATAFAVFPADIWSVFSPRTIRTLHH